MVKKLSLVFLLFCLLFSAKAQVINCTQIGQLSYSTRLSDVWGYVHSTGTEYALVGAYDGVSIVSLANPSTPVQQHFIPGGSTIWRDLKTWGNYLYVSSEIVSEGILVVNLAGLPGSVAYQYKFLTNGTGDTLRNAHNLWIDENGFLYIAGADIGGGAPLIYDLNADPWNPQYVGIVGSEYAHDVYVRGDTLWGSNIYEGWFSVYDLNNKANPLLWATQNTGNNFTHNAWLSDDGRTLFTTDERSGAYTEAYDVSDLSDIKFLDAWRSQPINDAAVIPHNVHVFQEYLIISHYTRGMVVLDALQPDNLVEVAAYNTYNGSNGGFFGCWGAYPYLPSGLILASDINTGLHILQADYRRGARLQGQVTEQGTGLPLFDVLVEIENLDLVKNTNLAGMYKTGIHSSGTYQVSFRKAGYIPVNIPVALFVDSTVVLNISMQPAVGFDFSGRVAEADNPTIGIGSARVRCLNTADFYDFDTTCNTLGNYTLSGVLEEEYQVLAGQWGFVTQQQLLQLNPSFSTQDFFLNQGIYDDFSLDFDWTVSGNIVQGAWERAVPNTVYAWAGMMPIKDMANDFGRECYITGVAESRSDAGYSLLASPVFDATMFNDPHLSFYCWMTSLDSTYAIGNDSLELWLYNGVDSVAVKSYKNGLYAWSSQQIFRLSDYIGLSTSMRIAFRVNNSHELNFIEAAIDKVQVNELNVLIGTETIEHINNNFVSLQAYPIPFGDYLNIHYQISNFELKENQHLIIYDLLGRPLEQLRLTDADGLVQVGRTLPAGVYLVKIGQTIQKVLKI